MGQIFYDMGFLASTEVEECSATDLVGEYVGHTGPKTVKLLTKAIGKVLFIDEAYRLGEGQFAKEAIDELVDSLTKPQFKGKIVVILAGYDEDINRLLKVNSGLSSRFPEEIQFSNLSPKACFALLQQELTKIPISIEEANDVRLSQSITDLFKNLASLPSWGNGRDIGTLATRITRSFFADPHNHGTDSKVTCKDVAHHLQVLLDERKARAAVSAHTQLQVNDLEFQLDHSRPPQRVVTTETAVKTDATAAEDPPQAEIIMSQAAQFPDTRDAGVTDAIWNELEAAKAEEERTRLAMEASVVAASDEAQAIQPGLAILAGELEQLELKPDPAPGDDEEANERKRRHEALRLKMLAERLKAQEAEDRLRKAEETRKKEAKVQQKLREMGVCCAGFRWIKMESGYRCAGGAHWVGNEALGI
jgi:ATPase family associated with various cellular activities (AAA)